MTCYCNVYLGYSESTVTIGGSNVVVCCPANSTPNATTGVCGCNTNYQLTLNTVTNPLLCIKGCPNNSTLVSYDQFNTAITPYC